MFRRSLTVAALAAAALALVPATASATPDQARVDSYKYTQYSAKATVVLSDGRTAEIDLMEDRSTGPEVRAFLSVRTYRVVECPEGWVYGPCTRDHDGGSAPLSDDQYDIDPDLGSAWVDASVPFVDWTIGTDGRWTQVETPVAITAVLTGTGQVSHAAHHSTECPMADECQSIRVESSRAAVSEGTFAGEEVEGGGRLFRGHSVDAAAPKFHDGGY